MIECKPMLLRQRYGFTARTAPMFGHPLTGLAVSNSWPSGLPPPTTRTSSMPAITRSVSRRTTSLRVGLFIEVGYHARRANRYGPASVTGAHVLA